MKPRLIAIDGPAGSGKSTLGREIAGRLGYVMLDAGLLYRVAAFACIESGIDLDDDDRCVALATQVLERVEHKGRDGASHAALWLDGQPLAAYDLYSRRVDAAVPIIAKQSAVREIVRRMQRIVAEQGDAILAGRDIGTVVAPFAELKLYLDVSLIERAGRRQWTKGTESTISQRDIARQLEERDQKDASRPESPLRVPPDAVVVRTDKLSVDGAVELILAMCGLA